MPSGTFDPQGGTTNLLILLLEGGKAWLPWKPNLVYPVREFGEQPGDVATFDAMSIVIDSLKPE